VNVPFWIPICFQFFHFQCPLNLKKRSCTLQAYINLVVIANLIFIVYVGIEGFSAC